MVRWSNRTSHWLSARFVEKAGILSEKGVRNWSFIHDKLDFPICALMMHANQDGLVHLFSGGEHFGLLFNLMLKTLARKREGDLLLTKFLMNRSFLKVLLTHRAPTYGNVDEAFHVVPIMILPEVCINRWSSYGCGDFTKSQVAGQIYLQKTRPACSEKEKGLEKKNLCSLPCACAGRIAGIPFAGRTRRGKRKAVVLKTKYLCCFE